MDQKIKDELGIGLTNAISEINQTIKNILPDKRKEFIDPSAKEESVKKIIQLLEYLEKRNKQVQTGLKIKYEEVFDDIIKIIGIDTDKDKLKKAIESTSYNRLLLIDTEGTNFKEYLKFMNNITDESYKKGKNKEFQNYISNLKIQSVMALFQFINTKFKHIQKFLFKKPFRFTSNSINKLINNYVALVGYYETFIKLMINSYDLIYNDKTISGKDFEKLSKLNFGEIVSISKNIPDFNVFLIPYDRRLRNKIIHKDFTIDYSNKKIIYNNKDISFKEFLNDCKELTMILLSLSWIYYFDVRHSLEKAYKILDNVEKLKMKKEKEMGY